LPSLKVRRPRGRGERAAVRAEAPPLAPEPRGELVAVAD
jgi:hypothetical protein